MAIDTAPKRRSSLDFGGEVALPGMPAPDGVIHMLDRQHLLWLYTGIAANSPAGISPITQHLIPMQGMVL